MGKTVAFAVERGDYLHRDGKLYCVIGTADEGVLLEDAQTFDVSIVPLEVLVTDWTVVERG